MSTPTISFHQVGKAYGRTGYRTLRHDLLRRRRASAPPPALADVSFDVGEGEALGIIGPNGAGKSTALRLAARITAPTEGHIDVRGRLGALIEVGAGIHPELTGRENIWLYGAILGLRRAEIAARFDDIVEFAELGDVLDRMVKHYSSGMQLRLGFAIAAGIRPDVLVVDEALAVGDARFQLRCIERMRELVHSGTTLLFVSHDLPTVGAVCERSALLLDGRLTALGPTADTVEHYQRWMQRVGTVGDNGPLTPSADGSLRVRVPLPSYRDGPVTVALGIRDGHPWNLLGAHTTVPADHAQLTLTCRIDQVPLQPGSYQVWAAVDGVADGDWQQIASLRIDGHHDVRPPWQPPVRFGHHWEL